MLGILGLGAIFVQVNEVILFIIVLHLFALKEFLNYLYTLFNFLLKMRTITAKFSGEQKNLEMFLNCGVTGFSSKFLGINNLSVDWVVDEESNEKAIEDCMSMVNTHQMELWDIEFKSIS